MALLSGCFWLIFLIWSIPANNFRKGLKLGTFGFFPYMVVYL